MQLLNRLLIYSQCLQNSNACIMITITIHFPLSTYYPWISIIVIMKRASDLIPHGHLDSGKSRCWEERIHHYQVVMWVTPRTKQQVLQLPNTPPQVCHPASSPPGGDRGQRQGQPPGGGHLCELTATVWWTPFRHPKPVYHSPIFYYRFVLCRRTRPMIYECGLSAQCKSMLLTLFVKILRTYVLSDCSLILQFQSRGIHVKGMTKTRICKWENVPRANNYKCIHTIISTGGEKRKLIFMLDTWRG